MAQAPDYESIYDVETPVEEAAKAVMKKLVTLPAFGQQDSEDLPDDRVDVQLALGGFTGHRGIIKRAPAPPQMARDAWNGTLTFTVSTRRLKPGLEGQPEKVDKKIHRNAVAQIRMGSEYFAEAFTEELMPYHVLSFIEPDHTEPQVNVEDALDISVLNYNVIVSVRTGAWPEY